MDEKYVVHPTAAMQHVESGAGEMEEAAWRAVDLAAVDEARSSVLSQRLTSVIWRQVNTAVLLSVVGTACGLVLTFWLPRLLALRSARLAEALRTAAEAGGRVRVPVTGNDELAAIARSINELGDRIAQNHAELALAARKMELTNADLRASEQRLELAISCASVGMGEWNGTSGVARANDRLSTMLGYRPGEVPLKAHAWLGLVHVEDRPAVQALAARAMFGGVDEIESEHRMRHNNGEDRWVQVRGRVLQRDAEGRALRVVLAQIDVTERVRAMERLEAQLAEASSSAADGTERIEQLRSSLRAPILALISLALLTQDESVDERARAQRAHRIAQRARAVLGVLDRPQLRGAEFENQMLLDAIESLGRAA